MKKLFSILLCWMILFASCAKQSDFEKLQSQVDDLENTQISTISSQITSINSSISTLQDTELKLSGYINDLQKALTELQSKESEDIEDLKASIASLEAKDTELKGLIDGLKTYVDTGIKDAKDWASATFTTLAQYSAVQSEISSIKVSISAIQSSISALDSKLVSEISKARTDLTAAISASEESMKSWVNEKLTDYYTIAEIEAKLSALKSACENGDEDLQEEIDALESALASAKTELTQAYQTAIASAIETNNGIINKKVADDIATAKSELESEITGISGRLASLETRVGIAEQKIATLEEQATNILASISTLEAMDTELKALIDGLDDKADELRSDLIAQEEALSAKIENLKKYIDDQLDDTKDWAEGTFATLSQYSAIVSQIEAINTLISDLGTSQSEALASAVSALESSISALETSMKAWVNKTLAEGYYDIATIDGKLSVLSAAITSGDKALQDEIDALLSSLTSLRSELIAAYESAITSAISEYNGVITSEIASQIASAKAELQSEIDTITTKIAAIEGRLGDLEDKVSALISAVQSVVVVPDYNDGSVMLNTTGESSLRFEIFPLSAAENLTEIGVSAFSLDYVMTRTKANALSNIPVKRIFFDGEFIVLIVNAMSLSEKIKDGTNCINARLCISDGTVTRSSEYFPVSCVASTAIEAVDFGLSVKWANCNLGANAVEDYGDYFAWGATEPWYEVGCAQSVDAIWKDGKSSGYAWENCPFWVSGDATGNLVVSKYCSTSSADHWGGAGNPDNKLTLELSDDAAHVILGGNWRMPTRSEFDELRNTSNFSWTWTSINGVNGYKVTCLKSGYTGKYIFLPASGSRYQNTTFDSLGESSCYWTSTLNESQPSSAWTLDARSFYLGEGTSGRNFGIAIRPVFDSRAIPTIYADDIHLDTATGPAKLNVTTSSNGTISYESSDVSVATVDSQGNVSPVAAGTANITIRVAGTTSFQPTSTVITVTVEQSVPDVIPSTYYITYTTTDGKKANISLDSKYDVNAFVDGVGYLSGSYYSKDNFANATNIKTITFGHINNTGYDSIPNYLNGSRMFRNCKNLTDIYIYDQNYDYDDDWAYSETFLGMPEGVVVHLMPNTTASQFMYNDSYTDYSIRRYFNNTGIIIDSHYIPEIPSLYSQSYYINLHGSSFSIDATEDEQPYIGYMMFDGTYQEGLHYQTASTGYHWVTYDCSRTWLLGIDLNSTGSTNSVIECIISDGFMPTLGNNMAWSSKVFVVPTNSILPSISRSSLSLAGSKYHSCTATSPLDLSSWSEMSVCEFSTFIYRVKSGSATIMISSTLYANLMSRCSGIFDLASSKGYNIIH